MVTEPTAAKAAGVLRAARAAWLWAARKPPYTAAVFGRPMPFLPVSLGEPTRAGLRLALALALSASLHGALLMAVRVGQVERPGPVAPRLTVRLAPQPSRPDAPVLQPTPQADSPVSEPAPQPEVPPVAVQAPSPPELASPAAEGEAREGMPEAAAGTTTLDLPLPPDPVYYPARQVDEHPVLVSGGKPVYPDEAARRDLKGEVIVLMLLNEHGRADEVSIVEAKPAGMGFEEAVIAWLREARFRPAMRQGRAVKARVVYHVTFEP